MAKNGKLNGQGKKFKVGYPGTIPIDPVTGKRMINDKAVIGGMGAAIAAPVLLWYTKKKKKEANEKAAKEGKPLPYPFTGKSPEKKQKGGEIKTPEQIKKMKKALDKLKPHMMGESVDAMTIIVEGEKKKRDKSISKSTQPYGAKYGGQITSKKKKKWGDDFWKRETDQPRPRPKPFDKDGVKFKKGGIVDTTKFRYI